MLIVLLHVKYDSASNLYLCQEIKVSQDEENFALLLEILLHVFLIDKQIVIHVWVSIRTAFSVLV